MMERDGIEVTSMMVIRGLAQVTVGSASDGLIRLLTRTGYLAFLCSKDV